MPKVEAKDHRHRTRPAPLSRPRFPTLRAEDYTYAFDRQYMSLRISGTGSQDFLSKGDARQLYGFLRRVYEPAERSTLPLRLERRPRQHSQKQAKRAAHQANPRPDKGGNEAHTHALDFGTAYYGSPSWRVYTMMTSFDEPRQQLEYMASHEPGGRGYVRRAILGSVENWKNNKPFYYTEATPLLVTDFLQGGVGRVAWTPVYETLRGEQEMLPEDANPFTILAYQVLAQTDWQGVVKDAPSDTQADDLLRSWLEDQLFTWRESPEARSSPSAAGQFANTVLDLYLQAVQWDKVTKALRGE